MGTHSFIHSFVRSFTCDHTAIGQTKNGQDAVQREMGDEGCDAMLVLLLLLLHWPSLSPNVKAILILLFAKAGNESLRTKDTFHLSRMSWDGTDR